MGKKIDLTGQRFGKWTVISQARTRGMVLHWTCRCDCGNTSDVCGKNLRRGLTKSCGCLIAEMFAAGLIKHFTTHGNARHGRETPEYMAWRSMLDRCRNQTHPAYQRYGGRGITVCERWNSFELFLQDVGIRPDARLSIDRIENSKGYEPGNVKWSTRREQQNNVRSNRMVEFRGESKPVSEWCRILGQPYELALDRVLRGWPAEAALTLPPLPKHARLPTRT